MRCWIGASRLPSRWCGRIIRPLRSWQPKRSRGHGSVNVARTRYWPRSACAPPALPRLVSAARSALDRAYLLTRAPQSLPYLPCRVARCARSCPMSLGAIAEAITQPPTNLAREDFTAAAASERGTGKLWTRLYGRKKRGSCWQPPPPCHHATKPVKAPP
jgi:hypothetical protein